VAEGLGCGTVWGQADGFLLGDDAAEAVQGHILGGAFHVAAEMLRTRFSLHGYQPHSSGSAGRTSSTKQGLEKGEPEQRYGNEATSCNYTTPDFELSLTPSSRSCNCSDSKLSKKSGNTSERERRKERVVRKWVMAVRLRPPRAAVPIILIFDFE
jgi:hypothetical protein